MSPEQQRLAIAEASGIKEYLSFGLRDSCMIQVASGWDEWDPLNDLNAMHQAEKVLTTEQWQIYNRHLQQVIARDKLPGSNYNYHATATQRAESFLRTLDLWKDTE